MATPPPNVPSRHLVTTYGNPPPLGFHFGGSNPFAGLYNKMVSTAAAGFYTAESILNRELSQGFVGLQNLCHASVPVATQFAARAFDVIKSRVEAELHKKPQDALFYPVLTTVARVVTSKLPILGSPAIQTGLQAANVLSWGLAHANIHSSLNWKQSAIYAGAQFVGYKLLQKLSIMPNSQVVRDLMTVSAGVSLCSLLWRAHQAIKAQPAAAGNGLEQLGHIDLINYRGAASHLKTRDLSRDDLLALTKVIRERMPVTSGNTLAVLEEVQKLIDQHPTKMQTKLQTALVHRAQVANLQNLLAPLPEQVTPAMLKADIQCNLAEMEFIHAGWVTFCAPRKHPGTGKDLAVPEEIETAKLKAELFDKLFDCCQNPANFLEQLQVLDGQLPEKSRAALRNIILEIDAEAGTNFLMDKPVQQGRFYHKTWGQTCTPDDMIAWSKAIAKKATDNRTSAEGLIYLGNRPAQTWLRPLSAATNQAGRVNSETIMADKGVAELAEDARAEALMRRARQDTATVLSVSESARVEPRKQFFPFTRVIRDGDDLYIGHCKQGRGGLERNRTIMNTPAADLDIRSKLKNDQFKSERDERTQEEFVYIKLNVKDVVKQLGTKDLNQLNFMEEFCVNTEARPPVMEYRKPDTTTGRNWDHELTGAILLELSIDVQDDLTRKALSDSLDQEPAENLEAMVSFLDLCSNHRVQYLQSGRVDNFIDHEWYKNHAESFVGMRNRIVDHIADRKALAATKKVLNEDKRNSWVEHVPNQNRYDAQAEELHQALTVFSGEAPKHLVQRSGRDVLRFDAFYRDWTRMVEARNSLVLALENRNEHSSKRLKKCTELSGARELPSNLEKFYKAAYAIKLALQHEEVGRSLEPMIRGHRHQREVLLGQLDACLARFDHTYRGNVYWAQHNEELSDAALTHNAAEKAKSRAEIRARGTFFRDYFEITPKERPAATRPAEANEDPDMDLPHWTA